MEVKKSNACFSQREKNYSQYKFFFFNAYFYSFKDDQSFTVPASHAQICWSALPFSVLLLI
jgi:hypothetical protein